jgi:serine/threonine-protein kinase
MKKKNPKKEKAQGPPSVPLMAAPDESRIGRVVGDRYRITRLLAEGGMGVVYKGERLCLGRPVAIKFLLEHFSKDPQVLVRFEREARAMSQLSHPNCVSVIDFGIEDAPYIVMDFVSGKTLRSLLDEGPVPVGRGLHIVKQLLAALSHAHKQGIIHRDIKPGNVMLSEATGMGDHVRVFDFGLAMLLASNANTDVSSARIALGTPAYMSPEQTYGSKVDARSDIYSTGLVLFELLTGRKVFISDSPQDLMGMHRELPPPSLTAASDGTVFSEELEAVVARALAKKPEDRFETVRDFADALLAVPEIQLSPVLEEPIPPSMITAVPPPKPARWIDRARPYWAFALERVRARPKEALIAAGVLLVLLVSGFFLVSGSKQKPTPSIEPVSTFEMVVTGQQDTEDASVERGRTVKTSIISAAVELLEAEKHDQAITLLRKMQEMDSRNAYYPYVLGRAFFERKWYKNSLEQYRIAIRMEPAFKEEDLLNEHLIDMLSSNKNYEAVRQVIVREVGPSALPHLQRAIESHPDSRVRTRAIATMGDLAALK